jgi:hypothetical protein
MKRLAVLLYAALVAMPLLAQVSGSFRWVEAPGGKLRLLQGAHHVLDYNYGLQLKPGVPEHRRREGYIYPLHTPAGVSPLDDFPEDHYHHRGVFWAWMSITYEGKTYDIWTLKPGIEHRFHKFLDRQAGENAASLSVENGWYVGGKLIVRETVDITVDRAIQNKRDLDLAIALEAVEQDVVIAGSPDQAKGYGGLCVRFAPRTGTRILTPEGPVTEDENEVPHAWAALEASYGGKQAGVRIASDPSNPKHPPGWCLRPYGFVGANFPGVQPYTLRPGSVLNLNYRVTVYDGSLRD